MTSVYGTDVYAYMNRARNELDSGQNARLFYAALELRCGIEARLQQYLDAPNDIAKCKKKGWHLAAAERELSRVFSDQRTIVELVLASANIPQPLHLFYTPVRK